MKQYNLIYIQSGSLLIEVMISIVISIFILSTLFEFNLMSKTSHQIQIALSQIRNNANLAVEELTSSIHSAGQIACARLTDDIPITSFRTYTITPWNRIAGNNEQGLRVRYMQNESIILLKAMTDFFNLFVNKSVHLNPGDILMITDCKRGEIFQVQSVTQGKNGQNIKTVNPLHYHYQLSAMLGHFNIMHYFIQKTNRFDSFGRPIFALFVKDIKNHTVELVEGINQLKFLFTLKQGEQFIDKEAKNIGDWSKVQGVNGELSVSSGQLHKNWYFYAALR